MKRLPACCLCFAATAFCQVHAEPFALDWLEFTSGGGASEGAGFSISATVGQVLTGRISGGNYVLEAGIGTATFFPPERRPILEIISSNENSVTLSWVSGDDFLVEQTSDLGLVAWTTLNLPANLVDGRRQITLTVEEGSRFYRLRQP